MITPNQIKEKKLSTSEHGYDIDETNAFIDEIAESYAAVYAENKELYRKMEILANKIVEYRAEEDTIKETLITAQKTAGEISKEAKEKAEKLISDARDYVAKLTKEKTDVANAIATEAEKKASGILNTAKATANGIIAQVKETSGELISKAKAEKEEHENLASKLKEESRAFKASLISLYEDELKRLKEMKDAIIPTSAEASEKLDSIVADMEKMEPFDEETADEAEADPQETEEAAEPVEEPPVEEPDEADEVEEIEEIEEVEESVEAENAGETEETEEISEISSGDAQIGGVDVKSAIDAFTADEITPIEGYPVTEITEEPEMEDIESSQSGDLPFESFFNVKHGDERTDEKLSLIPPDDYEADDDDDDDLKFRGFFKKRKK